MKNLQRILVCILVCGTAFLISPSRTSFQVAAEAGTKAPVPVAIVPNPCTPRFAAGSVVHQPPELYSENGVLNVRFSYQETTDSVGRLLHCFMTPDGLQEPTLFVNPGDTLIITVTNNTLASPLGEVYTAPNCGDTTVEFTPPASGTTSIGSSVNIHYHGTNVTPQCGGDNVTRTLINSGSTFQYHFSFPKNEPPGLYWYHPHVHGLAERDLLGGATGVLVLGGIQKVQPAVRGLRQRILVMRDQPQVQGADEGPGNCGVGVPFQDISVNYVPIDSKLHQNGNVTFTPAVLRMQRGETEFWRVSNSTADTILDLQVLYDGVPQTLKIVGIDAVPVNSQDGTEPGRLIPVTHYRLPVAGRVEFLVEAPSPRVRVAQLITNNINTGPQGDCDPSRPVFNIALSDDREHAKDEDRDDDRDDHEGDFHGSFEGQQRFAGAHNVPITANRTLQFSENQPSQFFIAVEGVEPVVFNSNNPPAIVTTQGAMEIWTIQNLAQESHDFHLHQIHYKVLSQENFEINGAHQAPGIEGQFMDTIDIPPWDNVNHPNGPVPQVKLLMDFRGMDVGSFVFHCHILSHEDLGMMAIIQVNPKK